MNDKDKILEEIRRVEGQMHLEKINNYNHMNWTRYNELVTKKNKLREKLVKQDSI